jgi:hypothetical protein
VGFPVRAHEPTSSAHRAAPRLRCREKAEDSRALHADPAERGSRTAGPLPSSLLPRADRTKGRDDGIYQDPSGTANGRAALVAHIGGFHATYPGHTIEQASGVDITDAGLRWAWAMRNGDEIALEGMDFAELAPDGRIQRIAGFFGPLPPLDE